ncbi:MAG: response regulator [Deltaproteobacteria bacterium]|nr:response regulator [Deltaproteobacteria bacterium]
MTKKLSDQDVQVDKPPKDFFRILLVDDEPVARHLLRAILGESGYTEILEAGNGQAALDALKREKVHLALVDKNMPGMGGLEVLKQGREINPDTQFILITAYGSMESAIQAMDMGAFSYLTKPFSEIETIVARVERALELAGLRSENAALLERMRSLMSGQETPGAEPPGQKPDEDEEQPDVDPQLAGKVHEAAERLRRLSAKLSDLRTKASGSTADFIGRMGEEVAGVAELLEPAGVADLLEPEGALDLLEPLSEGAPADYAGAPVIELVEELGEGDETPLALEIPQAPLSPPAQPLSPPAQPLSPPSPPLSQAAKAPPPGAAKAPPPGAAKAPPAQAAKPAAGPARSSLEDLVFEESIPSDPSPPPLDLSLLDEDFPPMEASAPPLPPPPVVTELVEPLTSPGKGRKVPPALEPEVVETIEIDVDD